MMNKPRKLLQKNSETTTKKKKKQKNTFKKFVTLQDAFRRNVLEVNQKFEQVLNVQEYVEKQRNKIKTKFREIIYKRKTKIKKLGK